jgi:hypothetical protein
MPFQKVEYEFPDPEKADAEGGFEIEIEPSSATPLGKKPPEAVEEEKGNETNDLDVGDGYSIEVVDDTPPQDRGRKPSDPPEDVTEDELGEYSEKVRKRIKHFSKGYHDERRAKEQALRERTELERITQKLLDENRQLKGNIGQSRAALLEQAKQTVSGELDAAKREYREAYEAGNADAIITAQENLTAAKIKADRLNDIKLPALQEEETPVELSADRARPSVPVDERAADWAKDNPWFGQDDEMTSYALGVHSKLVKSGVDPRSDEYYEALNARMRRVFPENFQEEVPDKRVPKRQANVVAPVTRSVSPKKVVLTQTQVAIAKRLGVSLKDYAEQVALEMRKTNG